MQSRTARSAISSPTHRPLVVISGNAASLVKPLHMLSNNVHCLKKRKEEKKNLLNDRIFAYIWCSNQLFFYFQSEEVSAVANVGRESVKYASV